MAIACPENREEALVHALFTEVLVASVDRADVGGVEPCIRGHAVNRERAPWPIAMVRPRSMPGPSVMQHSGSCSYLNRHKLDSKPGYGRRLTHF